MTLLLHWRALALIVSVLIASSALADEDVAACAARKVAFDGIEPLTYAKVSGDSNAHVSLLKQHPVMCKEAERDKCQGKAYLVPGDVVAVANTCGEYAHVQFIGEKRVSYGWVTAASLEPLARFKTRAAATMPQDPRAASHRPYTFRIKKGQDLPVCAAYLQRLNRSSYVLPPYCGRPEDDSVPQFVRLQRVQLGSEAINRLYPLIFNFRFRIQPLEPSGVADTRKGNRDVAPYIKPGFLQVWRYDPLIDPDNDGVSDNILVWQGLLPGEYEYVRACGSIWGESNNGLRLDQLPIIFDASSRDIDGQATSEMIAHSSQDYDRELRTGSLYATAGPSGSFRPVGPSIGIFKYRSLYYLDTFFDIWGDAENKRRGRPELANTLGVFLRADGSRRQLCEYQLNGTDYPKP
jgi:hypothetical protein